MKITSIRIGSFGALKNKTIDDIQPGLNVIYGKNESGKTTVMEFVRSTLFPSKQRKTYPVYSKIDEGEIKLRTKDGTDIKIRRKDGPITDSITSDTYRNVFAMTPGDLRDSSIISSGDIKKRFLTVPGGKNLPDVVGDLDKQMLELMTADRRSSNTKIGERMQRLEIINAELASFTGPNDNYDRLYQELSAIEEDLEKLNADKESAEKIIRIMDIQKSQEGNIKNLNRIKEEIKELSASDIIKEDDKEKYDGLKMSAGSASARFADLQTKKNDQMSELRGCDPNTIMKNASRIRTLNDNIDNMSGLLQKRTDLTDHMNSIPESTRPVVSSRPQNISTALGIILMIMGLIFIPAGIVTDLPALYAGLVLLPVGVFVIYKGRKNAAIEHTQNNISATETADANIQRYASELQKVNSEISSLERTMEDVLQAVGITYTDFRYNARDLTNLLSKCEEHLRFDANVENASTDEKNALLDLKTFLAVFGGEERFLKLCSDKAEKERLEVNAKGLEESIALSGYDKDASYDGDIPDMSEISGRINGLNGRFGEIRNEMRSMLNDERSERLMNERASLISEIDSLSRKWGMLSLASNLIDSACDEVYSDVQPGVVQTADRYIRIMTDGRYGLNNDPRRNDISVVSDDVSKTEEQWSSGLGDQILLSLKLAVAKELSSDDLPILLDDVLLMFDHDRKKGGCAVLADLSKDMQILLFTCDTETRDFAAEAGGNLIEL